jgi:hypothetical protein
MRGTNVCISVTAYFMLYINYDLKEVVISRTV